MLGVACFAQPCTRSRSTLPHRPQTLWERLGYQPDAGRFCGHGDQAPGAWPWNPQKRYDQDHRPATGRHKRSGKTPFAQSCSGSRSEGIQRPAEGPIRPRLAGYWGKSETTQTICLLPTALDYWICTTFPRERRYRARFLNEHHGRPLLECYQELAERFPRGLADLRPLPEESTAKTEETMAAG